VCKIRGTAEDWGYLDDGPDVEDADIIEVQMRRITLRLRPGATSKDVIWELAQLFPSVAPPIVQ